MFNDTFSTSLEGSTETLRLELRGTAWPSDLKQFKNPEDRKTRKDTSWLSDRYPTIIKDTEDVRNERFAVWMRPSAFANVRRPYGHLQQSLRKGDKVVIEIDDHFPAVDPLLTKTISFTSLTPWGGTSQDLALIILAGGVICFIAASFSALSGVGK